MNRITIITYTNRKNAWMQILLTRDSYTAINNLFAVDPTKYNLEKRYFLCGRPSTRYLPILKKWKASSGVL